eukprot:scaffold12612_cov112-Isochrysis_galbana.AAC.1
MAPVPSSMGVAWLPKGKEGEGGSGLRVSGHLVIQERGTRRKKYKEGEGAKRKRMRGGRPSASGGKGTPRAAAPAPCACFGLLKPGPTKQQARHLRAKRKNTTCARGKEVTTVGCLPFSSLGVAPSLQAAGGACCSAHDTKANAAIPYHSPSLVAAVLVNARHVLLPACPEVCLRRVPACPKLVA